MRVIVPLPDVGPTKERTFGAPRAIRLCAGNYGISVSYGAAVDAAPSRSDIRLLRQDQSVVDLDSEVADCALQLGMAEQELAGSQISGALVD